MPGKTLDELEGVAWNEATFDSHLVKTCHRLRTKPIAEFTVENLRIMIGQQIGLPHLIPLAVAILEREPLAEGDYYPGDLLVSVIEAQDWLKANGNWLSRMVDVVERAVADSGEMDTILRAILTEFLASCSKPPR